MRGTHTAQTTARRASQSSARRRPGIALEGVLGERMTPPGLELIIGGRNDPEWGAVVLASFGGVRTEPLIDVRLLVPGQIRAAIIGRSERSNALRCSRDTVAQRHSICLPSPR